MMNAPQFLYWLQGFADRAGDAPPTEKEWKVIKDRLAEMLYTQPPMTTPGYGQAIPRGYEAQAANPPPIQYPDVICRTDARTTK